MILVNNKEDKKDDRIYEKLIDSEWYFLITLKENPFDVPRSIIMNQKKITKI